MTSTTNSFTLTVTEVNEAPVLSMVPDQTVAKFSTLTLTLNATDPDLPANGLVFGLVSGPSGLEVSSAGVLTWTPDETLVTATNTVVVNVTDNGTPPLSAANSFTVIVTEVNNGPAQLEGMTLTGDGNFRFTVTGTTGGRYAVEWTTNFHGWTPVTTSKVPFVFETPLIIDEAARFYRAVAVL